MAGACCGERRRLGRPEAPDYRMNLARGSFTQICGSWWLSSKEPASQCGRHGFSPWVGKIRGEGNGNPLQDSCLENPMARGTWWLRLQSTRLQRVCHNLATKQHFSKDSMHCGNERWSPCSHREQAFCFPQLRM